MNAKQLRSAVSAQDSLRELYLSLLAEGHPVSAQVIHECGEAVQTVIALIVRGHVQAPRAEEVCSCS